MKYVKLNPSPKKGQVSSFFDPMQPKVESQSLSNHEQVIAVEDTEIIQTFIANKGLIEVDEKEYLAYRKKEDARISEELKKKGKTPVSDAATKALKEAHEKLQDDHEALKKTNDDLVMENQSIKAENDKLKSDNEKLTSDLKDLSGKK